MYFDHNETLQWCSRIAGLAMEHPAVVTGRATVVVLPTFPAIAMAVEVFAGTKVKVGAQNLFWEDQGAFTGEVSGTYLAHIGCRYVEIGHSERRRIFGEDAKVVSAKVAAALRNNLIPLVCIGESRRVSTDHAVADCIAQLEASWPQTPPDGGRLVVAYEPVWAIDVDRPAPIEHITSVCSALRSWLSNQEGRLETQVIYGGSATPGLLSQLGRSVDGLFLGRFAHDPESLRNVLDEVQLRNQPASRANSRHIKESPQIETGLGRAP